MADQGNPENASQQGGYQEIGLEEAKKRLRRARDARRQYEGNWFMNLAYYQGQQWVAFDSRGLYKPQTRKGQVTLTDNRVRPIVRTEVAKLTKERPGWGAIPDGMGDDAANSAQAATRLLDWSYDHLNFAMARRLATTWSRVCGAGLVKTCWDQTKNPGHEVMVYPAEHPQAGQAFMHPATNQVLRPGEVPELDQLLERKQVGAGDIVLHVRSPFDIFPDELATDLEQDCRWIFDESVRSPEYVQDHYKVRVEPDAPAMVGIVESGFHSAALDGASKEQVGVRVYEMWEPKSPSVPEGRHMVFTEKKVLFQGPNKYGCLPYVMFPGIVVPGRFWPDAVVTDLRPIQARWNKMISQIAENLSKFGNPSMLIDRLADVNIHGVPGERVKANFSAGGAPVQYLNPPSMPNYSEAFMEQLQGGFREISGQYEQGGSAVPPGVTAASAISLIQEQDATRLGPDVESLEVAIGKVGQMVINLIGDYYTTDRVITITGEDGIVDIDTFRSSATFKKPRISVVPNSTFPRSLAARQAGIRDFLNMFLQYQIQMPKAAVAKVMKDTQIGGLENLVGATSADVNQAQREWVDFLRGKDPEVAVPDDDHMHIDQHLDSAKSIRFRQLPKPRQQVWLDHINEHKGASIRKQQEDQNMAQIAASGVTPGVMPGQVPGAPAQNIVQGMPSGNPLPADVQRPPDTGPPQAG